MSFSALYDSMCKCKKGVLWKDSTAYYYLHGIEQTLKLEKELEDGTYKPRQPMAFTVYTPKKRDIIAIPFRDRVYQRSLNDNVIYPTMTRGFIWQNFACQKGKGTDAARKMLKRYMHGYWINHGTDGGILQIDIHGYYQNMDHERTKGLLRSKLPEEISNKVNIILDGQHSGSVGFNPGSQLVQISGISFLDEIDHFIKEKLHVRRYIRYMDDLILIDCMDKLTQYKNAIGAELEKIGMKFNEKKTQILTLVKGVTFLGYHFSLSKTGKVWMKLNPSNAKRERKKLKRFSKLVKSGDRTREHADQCYQSWCSHAEKGDNWKLLQRMDRYYRNLWRST